MTLASSTLVALAALLLNAAFGGSLLGEHPWAVVDLRRGCSSISTSGKRC